MRSTARESDVLSPEFHDRRLPATCQTERGQTAHHRVPAAADRRQKAAAAKDRGPTTSTQYRAALTHLFFMTNLKRKKFRNQQHPGISWSRHQLVTRV